MARARWENLVRHGFLGTGLVAAATAGAAADPCDAEAEETQVALVLGVELAPRMGLLGGIEVRRCLQPDVELLVRGELRRGPPRLLGGFRVQPFATERDDNPWEEEDPIFGLDAALALDFDGSAGLHAAAILGERAAFFGVQANLPVAGGVPTRWTVIGALAPWERGDDPPDAIGRPFVHDGRYLRPALAAPLRPARDREGRAVRDHFASAAQLELSSVWTFLRLAAELAAVGAPAALVARALDAADDEVRHAEACAAAAGGVALVPLPDGCARPRFTARTPHALATLAAESWREGCLEETSAAEEARLAAADAEGPIRGTLAMIARDEAGHAALAWDVLAWVLTIAPDLAASLEVPVRAARHRRRVDPALARRGVASPAVSAAARAHAVSTARTRLAALG